MRAPGSWGSSRTRLARLKPIARPSIGGSECLNHSPGDISRFVNRDLNSMEECASLLRPAWACGTDPVEVRAQSGAASARHHESDTLVNNCVECQAMGAAHEVDLVLAKQTEEGLFVLRETPLGMWCEVTAEPGRHVHQDDPGLLLRAVQGIREKTQILLTGTQTCKRTRSWYLDLPRPSGDRSEEEEARVSVTEVEVSGAVE